jgi:hypothetical protein
MVAQSQPEVLDGQTAQQFTVPRGKIMLDWFCLVFFVGLFAALIVLLTRGAAGAAGNPINPKVLIAIVAGPVMIFYSIRLLMNHVGVSVVLRSDGLVKWTRGSSKEITYREIARVSERRRYEAGLVLRTDDGCRVLIPFVITGYATIRESVMAHTQRGRK